MSQNARRYLRPLPVEPDEPHRPVAVHRVEYHDDGAVNPAVVVAYQTVVTCACGLELVVRQRANEGYLAAIDAAEEIADAAGHWAHHPARRGDGLRERRTRSVRFPARAATPKADPAEAIAWLRAGTGLARRRAA